MGKSNPGITPLCQNSVRCKCLQAGPGLGACTCCQALRGRVLGPRAFGLVQQSSSCVLLWFVSLQTTRCVYFWCQTQCIIFLHSDFFKRRASEYSIYYQVSPKLIYITGFTHNILLPICTTKLMQLIWYMNTIGFNKRF